MDTRTKSTIKTILQEGNKHRLEFTQELGDSAVLLNFSMLLDRENFSRLSTVITIASFQSDDCSPTFGFTLNGENSLAITFPVSGCFSYDSLRQTLTFPFDVDINGHNEKRAHGIASLCLLCSFAPDGDYFVTEYFVASDLYKKLNKILHINDGFPSLTINKDKICYATINLDVTDVKIVPEIVTPNAQEGQDGTVGAAPKSNL